MFPVRITSNWRGSRTISIAARSTYMWSSRTAGYSPARPATTSRQSCDDSSTFALSTDRSSPRRRPAASKATRAMRSISRTSYRKVLMPTRPPFSSRMPRGSP